MLLLQVLLLPWILYWTHGIDSHSFTMFHLSYFSNESFVEWEGNATLDGKLTHTLKGHNEQLNVSQLLPLEHPHIWEQREDNLQKYLKMFQTVVSLYIGERKAPYPFQVQCTQGCLLATDTATSFYEVLLNGTDFLRFHAANSSWVPLQDTPLANYFTRELNKYNETKTPIQFFLQETCINFVKAHTNVNEPVTGQHEGRSHTPLVLGIMMGALALMGLAVCIFLCTGGNR
ncbi:endothelial protein C receptor-like [Tiliqua scincoides]|uniref:endothelial protein C receptor-like n=1 Tax=Tiliqua scincoides TaxID=71010 RepID=UPI0034632310